MALTRGTGPFGDAPAGDFNFDPPRRDVVYVEPFLRRMRATLDGETVVDSHRAMLRHEHASLPLLFFPDADVREDVRAAGRRAPELPGYVHVDWHSMDSWMEEDRPALGHVRDPYHRVDAVPSSRHVRLSIAGTVVAESTRPVALFETGLPPRWYLPAEDVRDVLEPSETRTTCAYKGVADNLHARVGDVFEDDVAWVYRDPDPSVAPIRDLIAFYNERVDLEIDGEALERPRSPFSR